MQRDQIKMGQSCTIPLKCTVLEPKSDIMIRQDLGSTPQEATLQTDDNVSDASLEVLIGGKESFEAKMADIATSQTQDELWQPRARCSELKGHAIRHSIMSDKPLDYTTAEYREENKEETFGDQGCRSVEVCRRVHMLFAPGDEVLIYTGRSLSNYSPWEGPYFVLRRLNRLKYEVWKDGGGQGRRVVHCNSMKPYFGNPEKQGYEDWQERSQASENLTRNTTKERGKELLGKVRKKRRNSRDAGANENDEGYDETTARVVTKQTRQIRWWDEINDDSGSEFLPDFAIKIATVSSKSENLTDFEQQRSDEGTGCGNGVFWIESEQEANETHDVATDRSGEKSAADQLMISTCGGNRDSGGGGDGAQDELMGNGVVNQMLWALLDDSHLTTQELEAFCKFLAFNDDTG